MTRALTVTRQAHGRGRRALVSAAILALLTGCATTGTTPGATPLAGSETKKDRKAAQAQAEAFKAQEAEVKSLIKDDPIAAAAYWGALYDSDPSNVDTAIAYGEALRQIGSTEKALSVLTQTAEKNTDNPAALAAYGKALAAAGRAADAAAVLDQATRLAPADWTILSAAGIAQDQIGDHAEARRRYEAALKLSPENPTVLNNLALSRTLSGDLAGAETLLRRAAGTQGASAQIRQNLALVLGLQGKFDEAETLAGGDLLPQNARNNMDYIRELLGQPARWNDMGGLATEPTGALTN